MKDLFRFPFRCTKLKCGIIWAFVVMSAPEPQRGCHLGSSACRVPCEMALKIRARRGGRQCRRAAAAFSRVGGVLCSWGGARIAVLAFSPRNINTNWKTCEIQVERFWECSTSVFILLFYKCFVFLRNPASTLSRCNFLFRSKCYDIVCHL